MAPSASTTHLPHPPPHVAKLKKISGRVAVAGAVGVVEVVIGSRGAEVASLKGNGGNRGWDGDWGGQSNRDEGRRQVGGTGAKW